MLNITKLRIPFVHGRPSSLNERKAHLRSIMQMLEDEEDRFCQALYDDLKRPKQEALAFEVLVAKSQLAFVLNNLDTWAAEKVLPRVLLSMTDKTSILPQPYGLVLIIGAWNYPINLSMLPLIGAIAAGNAVVLKPSELAPASEKLIVELFPKYLDESVCQVFTGGAQDTMHLLDTQPFDYVFYTGGAVAAKSILGQIAKYLTPCTLELGGKCPVYVDRSADLHVCAKRVINTKCMNLGQTCVAPDYVICHKDVQDKLIEECKTVVQRFYGDDLAKSDIYGRIINQRHTERLEKLIKSTNGKIVYGGRVDLSDKFVELTIVKDVAKDDVLMQDEIFGPILPILAVESLEEAIAFVNSKPKPLALYVYANDRQVQDEWKQTTSSGSIVFNECAYQLALTTLPFGGVGQSGMGRYYGQATFDTFSNARSHLDKTLMETGHNFFRYPPYTESSEKWVRWLLKPSEGSYCNIC